MRRGEIALHPKGKLRDYSHIFDLIWNEKLRPLTLLGHFKP